MARRARPRLAKPEDLAAVYAAVVESALDPVFVVDEAGVVVAMNPAAEATFGYRQSEAVGRPIGALIVPEHLRAAHAEGMARYLATGERRVLGRRVEMTARHRDGRALPVELAITEVKLPGGRLFTANLRDLTPAREAAAEIERQRDALHQSEKLAALGSLLAGVAHELNNPLAIVLGHATLLREEAEAEPAAAGARLRAEKIEAAAERCARIVRSFLAIARQRKAERRAVAVPPLLDAAVELLAYGLTTGGVTLRRHYAESLPEVLADPDQIQQIAVNLLVNAAQALEVVEGPREIAVSVGRSEAGGVRVVVADSGPGVPAEIAARIFDPFFTTKPQGVGTGIGLSVSRGLAEAQGGRLSLLPTVAGAAFELLLPPAAGAAATAPLPAARVPDGAGRILVADDEPQIAALLAEGLARAGYRCDLATSGRETLARIAEAAGGYDALICDLRIPDLDGPAIYRRLLADWPELAERTLFVTGNALAPGMGRFLAEAGRPVLEKPFTPADAVRLLATLPARRETPPETIETTRTAQRNTREARRGDAPGRRPTGR